MWLELDAQTGQEKFFLVASSTRLEKLEKIYERHTNLEDESSSKSSVAAVLREISRLDQKDKRLSVPAEKPARLAGNMRDPNKMDTTVIPNIFSIAIELIAHGIYSKTFTIDHR
jgi:hypothetical protein